MIYVASNIDLQTHTTETVRDHLVDFAPPPQQEDVSIIKTVGVGSSIKSAPEAPLKPNNNFAANTADAWILSLSTEANKMCSKCRESYTLENFHFNRSKRDKRESHCKKCVSKSKSKKRKKRTKKLNLVRQFSVFSANTPNERVFVLRLKPIIEDIKS